MFLESIALYLNNSKCSNCAKSLCALHSQHSYQILVSRRLGKIISGAYDGLIHVIKNSFPQTLLWSMMLLSL